jgi:hypothetical protein
MPIIYDPDHLLHFFDGVEVGPELPRILWLGERKRISASIKEPANRVRTYVVDFNGSNQAGEAVSLSARFL